MLDRVKVLAQLDAVADRLFVDCSEQYEQLRAGWHVLAREPEMPLWLAQTQAPWALPVWHGSCGNVVPVASSCSAYVVVASDGSQIYPDKHQGTACFLIQSATVSLSYGIAGVPRVQLAADPNVFVGRDDHDSYATATDFVDCVREELEMMHGTQTACAWVHGHGCANQVLALFDGSLIFWHLQHKEPQMRARYVSRYVQQLLHLYQERIPAVWYISMPQSKELVHLAQAALWYDERVTPGNVVLTHVFDDDLASIFLEPGNRTIFFEPRFALCDMYPEPVRPRCAYMHVGAEIVRIEVPAWMCADEKLLAWVCSVVYDQVTKGNGYPVSLAEAHAHAVVQGADREFFYHAVQKMSIARSYALPGSLKRAKKRMLNF